MRILIVSQYFWPENFRVNDLAEELVRRGHEITVLTAQPNYPEGRIFPAYRADPAAFSQFQGASIIRIPIVPRGNSAVRMVFNYVSFVVSGLTIGVWKLRRRSFDVIFVFQPSPITAAIPAILLRRLKRAPMLLWILDLWPDSLSAVGAVKSPRVLALVRGLVRFIYKRCDRLLVQSRAFEPQVAALSDGSERIRYLPGWAEAAFDHDGDMSTVSPAPELAQYADDFKIVFAGNIGEAQDFPSILDAVEALRDLPHVRWIIVGDGRAASQVRDEIERRQLGHRIVLLGRYPLERMPSFFAGADALLVTLRKDPIYSMTIPGKVQSYLAAGRPLLAMLDGEGGRVVQEAGAGLVAPAADGRALAERVREMIALGAEERARMARRAATYGQHEFSRQRIVDALEGWMKECWAGSSAAARPKIEGVG